MCKDTEKDPILPSCVEKVSAIKSISSSAFEIRENDLAAFCITLTALPSRNTITQSLEAISASWEHKERRTKSWIG